MAEAPFIPQDEPEQYGPNYVDLRDEGLRFVQELAGDVWTDYNEHDPGVTILEQLCYALTELTYRASFSMADVLADERGVIDMRRHALFPPRAAFPSSPLTPNDYRRLIVDRVKAVGNVWLTPLKAQGLYDIELYVPGTNSCACRDKIALHEVRERVLHTYVSNRNLCEDIRAIHFLEELPTNVHGTITIDESRAPETILADLLFNVTQFLAPELRREPLTALISRGLAPSRIFEGPWLTNGFINDDELARPRLAEIPVRDIVRILAQTNGVIGVRGVSIHVHGHGDVSGNDHVRVPDKGILVIETGPDDYGHFALQLVRRGMPCKIDPEHVERELDKLQTNLRRRFPLEPQYEKNFALPRGRLRGDIAQYTSIQNQFPNVYGINAYGPPDNATTRRIAQARQLKGCLLVFEQLLADGFAQIGHAKDLFSTEPASTKSYFHQSLRDAVPNATELLDPNYLRNIEEALIDADPVVNRRNRFLDVLLALHADGLDKQDIDDKIALLDHLDEIHRNRGLGCDYLSDPSPDKLPAMDARSCIELGLPAKSHQLYVVEHTLLRPREDCPDDQNDFAYSFTVTAVLAKPERDADAFERAAREVLRRNAPAHIAVKFCFLRRLQMQHFAEHYESFLQALRERNPRAIDDAAVPLRHFLQTHSEERE